MLGLNQGIPTVPHQTALVEGIHSPDPQIEESPTNGGGDLACNNLVYDDVGDDKDQDEIATP